MSELNKQIGAEIRRIRKEKGLTIEQLGKLVNKPKSNISALENGKFNPSIDYLTKIAEALENKLNISFIKV